METTISALRMDERNKLEKIFQRNLKNPLTNSLKCDIIKTQKGERQQKSSPKKLKKIQKRA